MGRIFLSYAREDRACAERLARILEHAGHEVWWDRHISTGGEFSAEIEAALAKADVVLVAWSTESVKSRWVRDEAATGADTGRLLPVSIDGSLPPMGFRQFHTFDLTAWKAAKRDPRTAELLGSVERRLKGKEAPTEAVSRPHPKRRFAWPASRRTWAAAVMLMLLIIAGSALFFWTSRAPLRGPIPKPTIALLPITASSADADLRQTAAQTRDSLSRMLSQSGVPVRLLDSQPQNRRSAGDFLLSGELGHKGDKVVATMRLDEAIRGVTIRTQQFEAAGDDVRNLPERIGAELASLFSNSASLIFLDRRHPIEPALLAELLAEGEDPLQNYQITKRVAAKAPDEPSALISLAFFTGFALPELPREERQRAVIDARHAAEKALKLAPEFGDTYATWCLLHTETRLAECENHIRAGNRIDADAPFLNGFLADFLKEVGRFDEAVEASRLSYTHDPYDGLKIAQMLRMLEFVRDRDGARELYQQAARWYPDSKFRFFRNRLFGLIYIGDFEAMQRLEQEIGDVLPADFPTSRAIVAALRSKSQPALRRACATSEQFLLTLRCMIAFATIGDLDSAFAIAGKIYPRRVGRTPEETERIWLDEPDYGPLDFITSPATAPMRRDPRYIAVVERTGLLAYWRGGRLPDFCRKNREPICGQLLKRS